MVHPISLRFPVVGDSAPACYQKSQPHSLDTSNQVNRHPFFSTG